MTDKSPSPPAPDDDGLVARMEDQGRRLRLNAGLHVVCAKTMRDAASRITALKAENVKLREDRDRWERLAQNAWDAGDKKASESTFATLDAIDAIKTTAYARGFNDARDAAAVIARDDDGKFTWAGTDSGAAIRQSVAREISAAIAALKPEQG